MEEFFDVATSQYPWHTLAGMTAGWLVFRTLFTRVVLHNIGNLLIKPSKKKEQLLFKFCESSWYFSYYLVAFAVSYSYLRETDWFHDLRYCWIGWPQEFPSVFGLRSGRPTFLALTFAFARSLWLRNIYLLQLSNYIAALIFMTSRKHHKDFAIMAAHHIVTILLVGLSYFHSMFRVGSMVLIVHDVSDVFLELGKCFNYIEWDVAKNITFVIFVLTFFISRLIIYPIRVLTSVFWDSYSIIGPSRPLGGIWDGLLFALQLMHIYWFYLILKMVWRLVRSGTVSKDIRSEGEESDEDHHSKKRN